MICGECICDRFTGAQVSLRSVRGIQSRVVLQAARNVQTNQNQIGTL